MSAESELEKAVEDYRAFKRHGGKRGSPNDRARRAHISSLLVRAKEERARAERITDEDAVQAVEHIDVFGD